MDVMESSQCMTYPLPFPPAKLSICLFQARIPDGMSWSTYGAFIYYSYITAQRENSGGKPPQHDANVEIMAFPNFEHDANVEITAFPNFGPNSESEHCATSSPVAMSCQTEYLLLVFIFNLTLLALFWKIRFLTRSIINITGKAHISKSHNAAIIDAHTVAYVIIAQSEHIRITIESRTPH